MGLLTAVLGCEISWKPDGLQVIHPADGKIDVIVESGCPMVSQNAAMKLIEEIEAKAVKVVKGLKAEEDSEVAWLKRLVDEHPVFQGVPEEVKKNLVEMPAPNLIPLGNRRRRKVWKAKGMMIHAFSSENAGYTLGRAFHEIGDDHRLLHEFDITHDKPTADLSPEGEAYPLLLRAALDGWVRAWVAGPPCRTRSVLRHLEVPGESMPRPLRNWDEGEFGIEGLSNFEKAQVNMDDTLLMRFLLLYIVSETVRRASGLDVPTTLILEQPASHQALRPLASRSQEDVLRAIINMYMRLKADGHIVTQLHSDRGAEFRSKSLEKWCMSHTILQTYTPGDHPQMNGRPEATVQHLKAAIRRTLHGSGAPFERWPIAARFINEKLRQKQVDKEKKSPPLLGKGFGDLES